MLKAFLLFAMCFTMTLTLQTAGFSAQRHALQPRAFDMVSAHISKRSNAAFALQLFYRPAGRNIL